MNGRAVRLIIIAIPLVSCAPVWHSGTHILLDSLPSGGQTDASDKLERLYFGGIYEIKACNRYGDANLLAAPHQGNTCECIDGAIRIRILPVPYGVRLDITNLRDEPLTLIGNNCAMIDTDDSAHPAELRTHSALSPPTEPISQSLAIPPNSTAIVDLDVILPLYRDYIAAHAESPEERGGFSIIESPLPVFASGYYIRESQRANMQRVLDWALSKTFSVYLDFSSPNESDLGYKFFITPFRFGTGPENHPDEWEDPKPDHLLIR